MVKIGIDPDIKKSGFCILLNNEVKELSLLPFFDLTAHLLELKEYYNSVGQKYCVVIEKGEDNGNLFNAVEAGINTYYSKSNKSKPLIKKLTSAIKVGGNVAMKTGKNFAMSALFIEFCTINDIPYKTYAPRSAKWSHDYTKKLVKNLPRQTNPDKRDAIRAAVMG